MSKKLLLVTTLEPKQRLCMLHSFPIVIIFRNQETKMWYIIAEYKFVIYPTSVLDTAQFAQTYCTYSELKTWDMSALQTFMTIFAINAPDSDTISQFHIFCGNNFVVLCYVSSSAELWILLVSGSKIRRKSRRWGEGGWLQRAALSGIVAWTEKVADCKGRLCLDLWRGRGKWLTAEGGFVWTCGVDGKTRNGNEILLEKLVRKIALTQM